MGLQCSLLGHAFEDAGVEREREEQGSEVVTTEREIERCRRCGTERVVSESTEVAAVVDASDVGLEAGSAPDSGASSAAANTDAGTNDSDSPADPDTGITGAIERSDTDAAGMETDPDGTGLDATPPGAAESEGLETDGPTGSSTALDPNAGGDESAGSEGPPDPAEEDAEILTDDGGDEDADPGDREPGEWPGGTGGNAEASDAGGDDVGEAPLAPGEESLSGITVPEGEIVCPDCSFQVGADSGYRAGDPCPECGAWLEAERNQ